MKKLLLASALIDDPQSHQNLSEVLEWLDTIHNKFPDLCIKNTHLSLEEIDKEMQLHALANLTKNTDKEINVDALKNKSETEIQELTEQFTDDQRSMAFREVMHLKLEEYYNVSFVDLPDIPLSKMEFRGSAEEIWQKLSNTFLRDHCVIIDNCLAVCTPNLVQDEDLKNKLITSLEELRETLGLARLVVMENCYFEGGNVFVAKDLNGKTCVLQGAQPGGQYNFDFTDMSSNYPGTGLLGYTHIAKFRAASANAAFRECFGCSTLPISLSDSFKQSLSSSYLDELTAGIARNKEALKGKEEAIAVQSLYYHLDYYLHVTADNKIILMNKDMISEDSYKALCDSFGKDNIIDLNFDLDTIIKERPKLNLLCLDNKLIFPSMNPDLQKQAADILSKHGYEIAFLDSETTSSGSGFGGGIHCVTLQAPIQDAPTHRARP
jgi:hypothetical protein